MRSDQYIFKERGVYMAAVVPPSHSFLSSFPSFGPSLSIVPAASSSPIIVPTDSEDVETQDFMVCFVNGKKYTLHAKDIQPESTLLHFLRQSQNNTQPTSHNTFHRLV